MAAAAQLAGEPAALDDAHLIAVLLAEQRGDAAFAGRVKRGLVDVGGRCGHDELVGDALHLCQLLGRDRGEVREVEAKAIGTHVAASLGDVLAKHLTQRSMQDMRGSVVARDASTAIRIHGGRDGSALGKSALEHLHHVAHETLLRRLRIDDLHLDAIGLDDARVPHFAAHLGIERGYVQNRFAGLTSLQLGHTLAIGDKRADRCLGGKILIADETRGAELLEQLGVDAAVRGPGRLGVLDVGRTSAVALRLHATLEALHIHDDAALLAQLARDVHRETVRVVQRERLLAGKRGALELVKGLGQERTALAQVGAEALLLGQDDATDKLAVIDDLGVHAAHELDQLVHVFVKERLVQAQHVALHDGTTQQAAQHVAATLVRGQDAVGDHERDRTAVIGHDAQAQIGGLVLAVFDAGQTLAHADQAAQHVGIVVVRDALHDGGHALKAHAGVDVLGLKRGQRTVLLAVVLGEHAVPILKEAIAIATRLAVGIAATYLGALIEVDLGARAARAGRSGAPEVVILAQTGDMVFGHAERLPDLDGLVVVLEDGEVQLVLRKAEHLRGELEGPGAHLVLEIAAEAEVAQHLEERQVTGIADVVDVVGAHAFLHCGSADICGIKLLLMKEVGLELHHACAGEQKRRVIGDKGGGRHAFAALALEELQVLLADLRASHVLHVPVFLTMPCHKSARVRPIADRRRDVALCCGPPSEGRSPPRRPDEGTLHRRWDRAIRRIEACPGRTRRPRQPAGARFASRNNTRKQTS